LMRRCGFTAREAMGWLRVMRPGSVIGEQQHYLVAVERGLQSMRASKAPGTVSTADPESKPDPSPPQCAAPSACPEQPATSPATGPALSCAVHVDQESTPAGPPEACRP
jgi:hypothetical protein